MRSFPYVKGEQNTSIFTTDGIESTGIKIPEIKMSGSLTRFNIEMVSPGLSVGNAAHNVPIVAKQSDVNMTPVTNRMIFPI